jgi:hypothetical protein
MNQEASASQRTTRATAPLPQLQQMEASLNAQVKTIKEMGERIQELEAIVE